LDAKKIKYIEKKFKKNLLSLVFLAIGLKLKRRKKLFLGGENVKIYHK
jgi:hypothetical protein